MIRGTGMGKKPANTVAKPAGKTKGGGKRAPMPPVVPVDVEYSVGKNIKGAAHVSLDKLSALLASLPSSHTSTNTRTASDAGTVSANDNRSRVMTSHVFDSQSADARPMTAAAMRERALQLAQQKTSGPKPSGTNAMKTTQSPPAHASGRPQRQPVNPDYAPHVQLPHYESKQDIADARQSHHRQQPQQHSFHQQSRSPPPPVAVNRFSQQQQYQHHHHHHQNPPSHSQHQFEPISANDYHRDIDHQSHASHRSDDEYALSDAMHVPAAVSKKSWGGGDRSLEAGDAARDQQWKKKMEMKAMLDQQIQEKQLQKQRERQQHREDTQPVDDWHHRNAATNHTNARSDRYQPIVVSRTVVNHSAGNSVHPSPSYQPAESLHEPPSQSQPLPPRTQETYRSAPAAASFTADPRRDIRAHNLNSSIFGAQRESDEARRLRIREETQVGLRAQIEEKKRAEAVIKAQQVEEERRQELKLERERAELAGLPLSNGIPHANAAITQSLTDEEEKLMASFHEAATEQKSARGVRASVKEDKPHHRSAPRRHSHSRSPSHSRSVSPVSDGSHSRSPSPRRRRHRSSSKYSHRRRRDLSDSDRSASDEEYYRSKHNKRDRRRRSRHDDSDEIESDSEDGHRHRRTQSDTHRETLPPPPPPSKTIKPRHSSSNDARSKPKALLSNQSAPSRLTSKAPLKQAVQARKAVMPTPTPVMLNPRAQAQAAKASALARGGSSFPGKKVKARATREAESEPPETARSISGNTNNGVPPIELLGDALDCTSEWLFPHSVGLPSYRG